MNRNAIEKLRREIKGMSGYDDTTDSFNAFHNEQAEIWNAAIDAVLALEDEPAGDAKHAKHCAVRSFPNKCDCGLKPEETSDARKALARKLYSIVCDIQQFTNDFTDAGIGEEMDEICKRIDQLSRSALTPAPEIEGHDPDKCLGGLSCPVCSDLKTLVERAFNNGFDGWFGDEDPNGDRDHGYFLQLDDYEKIKEFLKAARQTLGREG